MKTAGEAVFELARQFSAAGIDTARLDARILTTHVMGITVEKLFTYPETELDDDECSRLADVAGRRVAREPLARITGEKEFWSLTFRVSEDTLVPRPDSECLIEAISGHCKKRPGPLRILDLGTGTGCLLISLLDELPDASGIGIDISDGALQTAKLNAQNLGVSGRADFSQNNWCEGLEGSFAEAFDIIVSNPPYIPDGEICSLAPEVSRYEPLRALSGGSDGLAIYRRLVVETLPLVKAGGLLVLEVGATQADVAVQLGEAAGYRLLAVHPDLAGIARCVMLEKPEK